MRVLTGVVAIAGLLLAARGLGTTWLDASWVFALLPIGSAWFVSREVRRHRQAPSGPQPSEVFRRSIVKVGVASAMIVGVTAYGVVMVSGERARNDGEHETERNAASAAHTSPAG
jgi:hypothetical protein